MDRKYKQCFGWNEKIVSSEFGNSNFYEQYGYDFRDWGPGKFISCYCFEMFDDIYDVNEFQKLYSLEYLAWKVFQSFQALKNRLKNQLNDSILLTVMFRIHQRKHR